MNAQNDAPAKNALAQVFVSYGSKDAVRVVPIAKLLEKAGVSVWRDGDRILGGQYYGEQIVHAIAHCELFLLICSPHSFGSDNVHREVLVNWEWGRSPYVPVWIGPPMEIPERFRYCLAGCQWVDATAQSPDAWLPQLLSALKAHGVAAGAARQDANMVSRSPSTGRGASALGPELRFKPGDRPVPGADWELITLLGKGGFGEVWKAHNPHLPSQPPVALKFCLRLDEQAKRLLRHEADMVLRVQQQVKSEGIVPLLHAYLNNDPPCLEYPYIPGGTLVQLLDEARQAGVSFKLQQVEAIVARIAQVLTAAHRATPKLVHRDLKPANVLVERRAGGKRLLRVTDFGIGGIISQPLLEESQRSSSLHANMAAALTGAYTPLYASPQQMRGDKPDPRDDVYALGVIWYQLLAGDLTIPAPTGRRWPEPWRATGMSEAALDLLASCFESDPAHRPADAGVLAEQLRETTQGKAASADSVPALPGVESPGAPRLSRKGQLPAAALTSPPAVETEPDRDHTTLRPGIWRQAEQRKWIIAGFGLVSAVVFAWSVWPRAAPPPVKSLVTEHSTTPADQSRPPDSLRVLDISVKHFANVDGKFYRPRGVLGKDTFDARCDDSVTVEATLSRPAYAYLISFRPDGTEELLFPEHENDTPELTDRPRYPSKSRGADCGLNEGAGLEAFALVVTSQPLPAYKTWRKKQGQSPWNKFPATPGVVWTDSFAAVEGLAQRGKGQEVKGKTEVASLADWLRSAPGVETVSAVGFSVLSKDKP
jgi:serine/threonine protein kinase